MKLVSTGGLGDAFIVALKIKELYPLDQVDWLHIESSDIGPAVYAIAKRCGILNVNFENHPDYIAKIQSREWADRNPINTSFSRKCILHNIHVPVKSPFLSVNTNKDFDICFQVSAGQNNDRKWQCSVPRVIVAIQRMLECSIVVIGVDPDWQKLVDLNGVDDRVNGTSMNEAFDIIENSKMMIGLSGLMTFYSLALRKPTVHLQYSDRANRDYIHPAWEKYCVNMVDGNINTIIRAVRSAYSWGVNTNV